MSARGVLYVHSAPPALCPHVEWAVAGIVGAPVTMPWVGQPAAPGQLRAELSWQAHPGTAGAIASALAGWNRLRFEVTEDSTPGCDGVRHLKRTVVNPTRICARLDKTAELPNLMVFVQSPRVNKCLRGTRCTRSYEWPSEQ